MARFNVHSRKFVKAAEVRAIDARRAIDAIGRGAKLMLMHDPKSPTGKTYYLVPGGPVTAQTAEKILEHPNVASNNDGLFADQPQSWSMIKS